MFSRHSRTPVVLTVIIGLLLPALSWASEPSPTEPRQTIVVVGGEGEEIVIDMVEVKDIVSEAMAGLEDVMTELDDMQFQFRMGQDNRVNLSYDDTTFELDLDQIMAQVATAVEIGLSEINTGQWTDSRHRWNHVAAEDLESELDELRSEMRELRAELRKLRNQNSD